MYIRHKKIYDLVGDVIEPAVTFIKKSRKRSTMPYKEIETLLKIFFPNTKYHKSGKGFFKHVFVIHSAKQKRKLVLKIGRKKKHIRKDNATYKQIWRKTGNRYFAKIYWRRGLFMLQKYGKRVKVPESEILKLKAIGEECGLKDIREANIMKFGNSFKIVDAERRN